MHIKGNDNRHIESEGCWCNPTTVIVEGEENIIHNIYKESGRGSEEVRSPVPESTGTTE